MFLSPRIPLKPLVGLCNRLSTALEAGIDVRTVLTREAGRANGPLRRRLLTISKGINSGESLSDSLTPTGDFFPALFRELVAIGEQTGQVDVVLAQLADHYQNQLELKRIYRGATMWPIVQLVIAMGLVGFLIWIMGILPRQPGATAVDPLGLGLIGERGLAIYVAFLAAVGLVFWVIRRAIVRGMIWVKPIQRLVLYLPGIGKPLQTLALARLAWTLRVTLDAGMDVQRALKLSLRSTRNARYIGQIRKIDAEIARGSSIHEAFAHAGGYPHDFLDTVAVGEDSGRLVASMGILARQYQEQARAALAILAMIGGWVVWAGVAAIIIMLIFRMFSFYLNAIGV